LNSRRSLSQSISLFVDFFNATEVDDDDPLCYRELTWEHVKRISDFCRRRSKNLLSRLMYVMRGMYARIQFLEKKKNPVGWVCAIQRPYAGLVKAYRHYWETRQSLPNFFVIIDDNTYYNMDAFKDYHESVVASIYPALLVDA